MKVADSSHYLEKFNEVLNLVEKECIEGDADFVEILNSHIYWNAKYLQKVFGYVADISLKDYVRRRRLTEAFYKITDFENQKMSYAVNGIANAKRKIIREFGVNPQNLQPYFYDEVSEEMLLQRLEWKLENGLWKREEINAERFVLYSSKSCKQKYDLDRTYFMCQNRYFGLKGSYIGQTDIKDVWMSALFQKDVYIAIPCYESATKIVGDIYQVMSGITLSAEQSMNLSLDVHLDDGFELRNLVTEVMTQGDVITDVKVDKMLKIEGDELVLDLSHWFDSNS